MKERPIILSGEMVRALLAGRKTQTRRPVKFEHAWDVDRWAWDESTATWRMGVCEAGSTADMGGLKCPYGQPGDQLWVRETWACDLEVGENTRGEIPCPVWYRADGEDCPERWQPATRMPRWASRITLELTDVRVERLQDISEKDAKAEGATLPAPEACPEWFHALYRTHKSKRGYTMNSTPGSAACFHALWDSIYGGAPWRCWDDNPWVWALTFRRVETAQKAVAG